ncbi:hypothetical protein, partial [Streptomyces sp. ADI97-07]|uniref:hypothetical protein n=1 Tax=Streptomyces sp. ADI97-07 TaxID=1522762 RepID=UPI0013DD9F89
MDGRPSQSGTFIPGQNTDFALDAYDTKGQGILRTRVPKGTYLLETPVQTRKGTQADPDTRKGVTWGFATGQHQPGNGDDSLEVIFNEPTPK